MDTERFEATRLAARDVRAEARRLVAKAASIRQASRRIRESRPGPLDGKNGPPATDASSTTGGERPHGHAEM